MEFIDIRQSPISHPAKSWKVKESSFGVAPYTPDNPFIISYGFWMCRAIIFFHPLSKAGLFCHLVKTPDLKGLVKTLVDHFPPPITESTAHVISGRNKKYYPPNALEIATEIEGYHPKHLYLDNSPREDGPYNIGLNLWDGTVHELVNIPRHVLGALFPTDDISTELNYYLNPHCPNSPTPSTPL